MDIYWEKFFKKLEKMEDTPVQDWDANLVLGYFLKKYKEFYNIEYTFTFKASPSKSYEFLQVKRLISMLTADPVVLKQYIDWLFEIHVKSRKKKITSIAFVATPGIITDFKFKYLANNSFDSKRTIERSSPLSEELLTILRNYNNNSSTYGDLAFYYAGKDSDNNINLMFNDLFSKKLLEPESLLRIV